MGICTSDCGQAGYPIPRGYGIWQPTIPATAFSTIYGGAPGIAGVPLVPGAPGTTTTTTTQIVPI